MADPNLQNVAAELHAVVEQLLPGTFDNYATVFIKSEPLELARDCLYYLAEAKAAIPAALLAQAKEVLLSHAASDPDDIEEFAKYLAVIGSAG